jgi:hypothetical protein
MALKCPACWREVHVESDMVERLDRWSGTRKSDRESDETLERLKRAQVIALDESDSCTWADDSGTLQAVDPIARRALEATVRSLQSLLYDDDGKYFKESTALERLADALAGGDHEKIEDATNFVLSGGVRKWP